MIPEYRTNKALAISISAPLKGVFEHGFSKDKAEALSSQFTSLAESTFYGLNFEATLDRAIHGDLQQGEIDKLCKHLVVVLKDSLGDNHPEKLDQIKDAFRMGFRSTIEAIMGMEQQAPATPESTNLQDLSFLLD